MRATLRITWLLLPLSLSFLFHSVCSSDDPSATSVTKNDTSVTTAPTAGVTSGAKPSLGVPTGGPPMTGGVTGLPQTLNIDKPQPTGTKKDAVQVITTTKPREKAPFSTIATIDTFKPTIKSAPTQSQSPVVSTAPSKAISGVVSTLPAVVDDASNAASDAASAAAAATTISQPKPVPTTATANSGKVLEVPIKASSTQKPNVSVTSKANDTEALQKLQGEFTNEATTTNPKDLTDAPITALQPLAGTPNPITTTTTNTNTITTIATTSTNPKTSREDGKEGTQKMTVTDKMHEQTSRIPGPAGNPGTTSGPSAPTKAGPPAVGTLSTKAGTTPQQTVPTTTTTTTTMVTTTTTVARPQTFSYSLNNGREKEEEKELVEVCKRLMANLDDGNCTLSWRHRNGKTQFDSVEISGKVKTSLAAQYYEEITKKPTDNRTLIAILASCGALLIMIVILAVCASHHRKPYRENQQHLTEELHTVENGYHDNPTLEVMEVQPEMQEKKVALNGEFNDSWIVPIDNLLKEDIPDEEDTHL